MQIIKSQKKLHIFCSKVYLLSKFISQAYPECVKMCWPAKDQYEFLKASSKATYFIPLQTYATHKCNTIYLYCQIKPEIWSAAYLSKKVNQDLMENIVQKKISSIIISNRK